MPSFWPTKVVIFTIDGYKALILETANEYLCEWWDHDHLLYYTQKVILLGLLKTQTVLAKISHPDVAYNFYNFSVSSMLNVLINSTTVRHARSKMCTIYRFLQNDLVFTIFQFNYSKAGVYHSSACIQKFERHL